MHIDRYTKAVLTVIAVALVYLCAVSTPLGTPVHAQDDSAVVLVGWRGADGKVNKFGAATPLPVHDAAR
jgi:hypothetical protein